MGLTPKVMSCFSSHSLQLAQVCGSPSDGESSSAIQDEANQYRRVTVDDNMGSSSENIGTLVRISQIRSTKPNSGSRFLSLRFLNYRYQR